MPSLTIEEIKRFSPLETNIFIETGTLIGDTLNNVKSHFAEIYSIELNDKYVEIARERFKHDRHIHIILGDSSDMLIPICKSVTRPVFFWLDGHWSGGTTARGNKDCPLIEELNTIVTHCKVQCIIAIDDVRLFGTNINEDWSDITRSSILNIVKERLVSCNYYSSVLDEEDRMVIVLRGI